MKRTAAKKVIVNDQPDKEGLIHQGERRASLRPDMGEKKKESIRRKRENRGAQCL